MAAGSADILSISEIRKKTKTENGSSNSVFQCLTNTKENGKTGKRENGKQKWKFEFCFPMS